jgi:hypothetical protein
MKFAFTLALLASATLAHAQGTAPAASASTTSPAKKELIAKALTLQQPIFESMAREIVMRPAVQMGQAAGNALQNVPQDKREAMSKGIDADIRKYIDDAYPLLRDRAVKLAPTTIGPILDDKMSEDELKQLVTWLDSAAAKKYQAIGGDLQQALGQKLIAEAGPLLTPKVQALEQKIRGDLGMPPVDANTGSAAPATPAPKAAAAPKKAASK